MSTTYHEKPTCVAVILCNEVIEDKRTNNKTLVHLFNGVMVPQFPAVHGRMAIVVSLTGGTGKSPITFRILSPSDKEILRFEGEAAFPDPLSIIDIVVEVHNLVLEEEGMHFVDVLTGDYPLGNRKFTVQLGPPQPAPR